ncbi:Trans-hexaprenyltranstransferase [Nitrococcus mobilis Nb-231]|uniref:Trans-hexaprenyltranstransferase n=1 Tax=Nitrococcus mobilis Nb-231 TaxID=314278 RepID=A4BTV1_9GAMM|nr:Trans-hexaprenyltranstransferase [Nitrococcus mobilis Nb-231]
MELDPIRALVAHDIEAVNELIRKRLSSDVVLINRLGSYIINSGGKRLRPLVVLLAARACSCRDHQHILLAAIVEMIHTATLLHDDVVDESDMRRGRETARQIWGNGASVLVGDFLYTRAFEMMVELQQTAVMGIFSRATNTIAEGEVLQLLNIHDPDVTEERYREVIFRKTAALFEAGCRLAALLGARSVQDQAAMAAYGRHLGTAFQLIDDALDYDGNAQEIGKNIGDDLAEGKPTMPFIYAMQNGDAKPVS